MTHQKDSQYWRQHDALFEDRKKSGEWPAKKCEQCTSNGCCRRHWHHIGSCCTHCGLDERNIMPIETMEKKCHACLIEAEFGTKEDPHPISARFHVCKPGKKYTWEDSYQDAKKSLEFAHKTIDDIAGWSGASGNWPLQECAVIVQDALKLFAPKKEEA